MEAELLELEKLVQAIHKREKSFTAYQCYDTAIQLLHVNALNKISESLQAINYELQNQNPLT